MDWVCLHLDGYNSPRRGGGEPENDDNEKIPHICGGERSALCQEIFTNCLALKIV